MKLRSAMISSALAFVAAVPLNHHDGNIKVAEAMVKESAAVDCNPDPAPHEIWIGTAPSCGGSRADCEDNGMDYVRLDKYGDGDYCWTGKKVLCREKTTLPSGSVWIGTAPVCVTDDSTCSACGMENVRKGKYGASGNACNSGRYKRLCKPRVAPEENSLCPGTASKDTFNVVLWNTVRCRHTKQPHPPPPTAPPHY